MLDRLAQGQPLTQPLLLSGHHTETLRSTVRWLAAVWLCSDRSGPNPCGRCSGCRDVERGIGDRFRTLDAALSGGVEALRALRTRAFTKGSAHQVLVLERVDAATAPALQQLLKVLEEVPSGSSFLLTVERPLRLPATLRSRCLTLSVPPKPERVAPVSEAVRSMVERLMQDLPSGLTFPPEATEVTDVATAISHTLRSAYGLSTGPRCQSRILAQGATHWLTDTVAARFSTSLSLERLLVALHP